MCGVSVFPSAKCCNTVNFASEPVLRVKLHSTELKILGDGPCGVLCFCVASAVFQLDKELSFPCYSLINKDNNLCTLRNKSFLEPLLVLSAILSKHSVQEQHTSFIFAAPPSSSSCSLCHARFPTSSAPTNVDVWL